MREERPPPLGRARELTNGQVAASSVEAGTRDAESGRGEGRSESPDVPIFGVQDDGKTFLPFMVAFAITVISARTGASGTRLVILPGVSGLLFGLIVRRVIRRTIPWRGKARESRPDASGRAGLYSVA